MFSTLKDVVDIKDLFPDKHQEPTNNVPDVIAVIPTQYDPNRKREILRRNAEIKRKSSS